MRVAIVCEGRTDFLLLEQIVLSVYGSCQIDALQPLRDQLDPTQWSNAGWTRVKEWCEARLAQGIEDDMIIGGIDVLVLQVDGDLCGRDGLPATRTALCDHIKQAWIGPPGPPPGVVICIPAMATDAWLAAALDPTLRTNAFEADPAPVTRLEGRGIKKNQYDYMTHASTVRQEASVMRPALPELDRFLGKLEALAP